MSVGGSRSGNAAVLGGGYVYLVSLAVHELSRQMQLHHNPVQSGLAQLGADLLQQILDACQAAACAVVGRTIAAAAVCGITAAAYRGRGAL